MLQQIAIMGYQITIQDSPDINIQIDAIDLVLDGVKPEIDINRPAATALSGHRVVLSAADGIRVASNADPTHLGRVFGITTGAVMAGELAPVRPSGLLTEPSWNWSSLTPVFLGIDGELIQVVPQSPAIFAQIVGIAIAPDTIFINIQSPIVLG